MLEKLSSVSIHSIAHSTVRHHPPVADDRRSTEAELTEPKYSRGRKFRTDSISPLRIRISDAFSDGRALVCHQHIPSVDVPEWWWIRMWIHSCTAGVAVGMLTDVADVADVVEESYSSASSAR